jgi:hypothetical protein
MMLALYYFFTFCLLQIHLKKPKVSPNRKKRRSAELNQSPAATYTPLDEHIGAMDNRILSTLPGILETGSWRESRDSVASSTMSYDSASSVSERISPEKTNTKMDISQDPKRRSRSVFYVPTPERTPQTSPQVTREPKVPQTLHPGSVTVEIKPETEAMKSLRRLYLMSYFPSGFWARLITRLLADQSMYQTVHDMYTPPQDVRDNADVVSAVSGPEWLCYHTKQVGIWCCAVL